MLIQLFVLYLCIIKNENAMKTTEIIVIKTCRKKGTKEEVSFEYAVKKLNGYWDERDSIWADIQNSLLKGEELFTPYSNYQAKLEK